MTGPWEPLSLLGATGAGGSREHWLHWDTDRSRIGRMGCGLAESSDVDGHQLYGTGLAGGDILSCDGEWMLTYSSMMQATRVLVLQGLVLLG